MLSSAVSEGFVEMTQKLPMWHAGLAAFSFEFRAASYDFREEVGKTRFMSGGKGIEGICF